MSSYWQAAERALPRNCSNDWIAVTKYVDDVFTNGSDQEIRSLKAQLIAAEFTGPGGNTTVLDNAGYLNDVDSFDFLLLALYLMDPLGQYQVRLSSTETDPRSLTANYSPTESVQSCRSVMS